MRVETIISIHAREMINSAPEQREIEVLIEPYIEKWHSYHRNAGHHVPSDRLQSMRGTCSQLLQVIREVHESRGAMESVELDWGSPDFPSHPRMIRDLFDPVERKIYPTRNSD